MRKGTMSLVYVGLLSVLLMMPLTGCSKKTVKVEPAEETAVVADTAGAPSRDSKNEKGAAAKGDPAAFNDGAGPGESLETPPPGQDGAAAMSGSGSGSTEVVAGSRTDVGLLPIYFDFDKSLVRQDQVERIAANALFLKSNPEIKVRIEGNCDNRGTNEYNLALGERRAMGTKKYLVNLGIPDSRLSILSYGEERPINPGNDETAWAQNRRGDFVMVQ
ncbi:MAG: peptidoglycan-associated lipoprotein Pal [Desulfobulbaceae bacterium]|nr:peptidoglycan-associated lipoprotein Pal [Desulfobulbaceae bacterium]